MVFSLNLQPANAYFTSEDIQSLTYEQVKGTGLANTCPDVLDKGSASIPIKNGSRITNLCIEPQSFNVLERSIDRQGNVKEDAVKAKVMTRQTYTLTGIEGPVTQSGGSFTFAEQDGIDYAASTVQLPGGERVPFLFTVKNLVAQGKGDTFRKDVEFGGSFKVPSYRTGLFLDPKGRGAVTGYDQAVALPGRQNGSTGGDDLFKENNKVFDVGEGKVDFRVLTVNAETNEIGGVFVQTQPSDTDMGSKAPKTLLLKGKFFAALEN